MNHKTILRLLFITLALLLIPAAGMLLSDEWNWGPFDFVFAFVLLFGSGFVYAFFAGRAATRGKRIAIGTAVAVVFLAIWTEAAVGAVSQLIDFLLVSLG